MSNPDAEQPRSGQDERGTSAPGPDFPADLPLVQSRPIMRPVHKKEKKRIGRTLIITVSVISALVLLVAGAIGWFGWRLASSFNKNATTITDPFPDNRASEREDGAQTILLLGSDTRGNIDGSIKDGAQDGRSDTIMVARIAADRDAIYVMSIPRDAWVEIPGHGDNKINAALAFGGVKLAVETIEDLLGTRIDHVAVVDFQGFKGLTDALGGVTVNNSVEFESGGFTFATGPIELNGEEALAYVRTRKAFGEGDYRRMQNQQAYMKGVVRKLLTREILTSPKTLIDVVDELSPYLQVDKGLNPSYLISLAPTLRDIRPDDVVFFTAPTTGPAVSPDGNQSIIELDWPDMETLKKAFEEDTVGQWVAENE